MTFKVQFILYSRPQVFFARSNHQRCSVKKVAGGACNFIKKETLAQVFSCEFCEISKNTFFREHIWVTASV